jgi:cytochrome c biogenesis protein CcdA
MFLLDLIRLEFAGVTAGQRIQERARNGGAWTAALLGFVFALSFCPVSAALFFGSLVPLSLKHGSVLLLPSLYGIGTGLPVALFAVLIAAGAASVGTAFNRLTDFERWARRATGAVFILVGAYYALKYIFAVPLPF